MDIPSFRRQLPKNDPPPVSPPDTETFVLFSQFPEHGIPQYSRVHLRRLMRVGLFPVAHQLSPNRVGWALSELQQWKRDRPRAGRFSQGGR
jgi:hypothetical protein